MVLQRLSVYMLNYADSHLASLHMLYHVFAKNLNLIF